MNSQDMEVVARGRRITGSRPTWVTQQDCLKKSKTNTLIVNSEYKIFTYQLYLNKTETNKQTHGTGVLITMA
jgi:hypothetical protein